jgi:hypothetical protein
MAMNTPMTRTEAMVADHQGERDETEHDEEGAEAHHPCPAVAEPLHRFAQAMRPHAQWIAHWDSP